MAIKQCQQQVMHVCGLQFSEPIKRTIAKAQAFLSKETLQHPAQTPAHHKVSWYGYDSACRPPSHWTAIALS